MRAACEARREEEREAALGILAKGHEAVAWLRKSLMEAGEDLADPFVRQLDMLRTLDGLTRLACGEFGAVRHSVRAAGLILPLAFPGCRSVRSYRARRHHTLRSPSPRSGPVTTPYSASQISSSQKVAYGRMPVS